MTMRLMWNMEKSEMQKRYVLFQEEDKDSYVGKMLNGKPWAAAKTRSFICSLQKLKCVPLGSSRPFIWSR